MKYQRLYLLIFCLSFLDVNAQHFVIEGKTNGYIPDGSILYLGRWNGMGPMFFFTSAVIQNGTFRLEGKREKSPDLIYLYGTEKAIGTLNLRLWVGDDTVRVSANTKVPATWIVENSVKEQQEESYYMQLRNNDILEEVSRINNRLLWDKSLSSDSAQILSNEMIQIDLPGQIRVLESLHTQEKLTDVGLFWLFYVSGYASRITNPNDFRMGKETYAKLSEKQKQTYYGKIVKKYFYPEKAPDKGDYYIDADLADLKGDSCKLTDHLNKGKYVLLDFWDQYCSPCMKSISGLKELRSSCPDKLDIISINVGNREGWEKGSTNFQWESLSDGQGMTGIAARYGVKSIPYFVLMSPKGRIEKCWRGYAMRHSNMEKEIIEIIGGNNGK